MRRSKFTEEQVVVVLKQAGAGVPSRELVRKYGIIELDFIEQGKPMHNGFIESFNSKLCEDW